MFPLTAKAGVFSHSVRRRRKLPIPATPRLRIAQVSNGNQLLSPATPFPRSKWARLRDFKPNILVGSLPDLMAIARSSGDAAVDVSSLDHAIFVLSRCGDKRLLDTHRVVLWQRFGLPVYELLTDEAGGILAAECEAYDGLHGHASVTFQKLHESLHYNSPGRPAIPTGLTGYVETVRCSCGRPGVRLKGLELSSSAEHSVPLAATA